jgi:hypothetical protein
VLEMYVITTNTSDYGDKHVVRRHCIGDQSVVPDADPFVVCDSLDEARSMIPAGLVRGEPSVKDDLVIVEFWF